MSVRVQVVLICLALAGCVSERNVEIETSRQHEVDRIHGLAVSKLVMPECNNAKRAPGDYSPPSTHQVQSGTMTVSQPCGLISVEMMSDLELTKLVATLCTGISQAACGNRVQETFFARLRERYGFTDWAAVSNRCTAYPIDCKWMNIELWAIESHNAAVVQWAQQSYRQTNERYQEEFDKAYAAEEEQRRRALSAFATAITPPPSVQCTSSTIGTTTTTNCH